MLSPEQAALEIRAFAKDESGIGNIKSAYAALAIIESYLTVGAKPSNEDEIFATLFWQHLNLLWKMRFVKMNILNRWRAKQYAKELEKMLHRWRDMPTGAPIQSSGKGNVWSEASNGH